MDDRDLLREYVQRRSQAAFAELVRRHIDLVYTACLRQIREPQLAEDATQAVFLILAQCAATLSANVVLAGWLYNTARHAAANVRRTELRRKHHERKAAIMRNVITAAPTDPDRELIIATLDDAVASLGATDRNAVLLRFFERKTVGQTAAALGIAEEAAKKRVARAVEKLRGFFGRRGVELSAAALAAALSETTSQAAPAALADATAGVASNGVLTISGSANVSAIAKGAALRMASTGVGLSVAVAATLIAGAGAVQLIRHSIIDASRPAAARIVQPIAAVTAAKSSSVYQLGDGEIIKRIAPPYPAERTELSIRRAYGGRLPNVDLTAFGSTIFYWVEPADLQWWGFSGGSGNAGSLLSLADIHGYQVAPAGDLLKQPLPGDWIVRKSATVDQRLRAVESYLRQLPNPVRLDKHRAERDVIVVRGIYEFHPVPGLGSPREIHLGGGDLLHPKVELLGAGGGSGKLADLFETLAGVANQYVIDETLDGDRRVVWKNHRDGTVNEQDHDEGRDSLLQNLARQTSLQFTIERRTVDVWTVSAAR